jgi:O-antigen/teichoic acid export membrane protein
MDVIGELRMTDRGGLLTAGRDFMAYAAGNLLAGGMSFLLVPVYTRVLAQAQYGAVDIISVTMGLVGGFLTFGLNQLIGIRYFQYEERQRNQVITDLIGLYVILATPLALILVFLSKGIAGSIFGAEVTGGVVLVAVLVAYLSFYDSVGFSLLQQERRARLYALVSVCKAALILGTSIVLVVVLRTGVIGVFVGILMGKVVGAGLLGWNWLSHYSAGAALRLSGLRRSLGRTLWTSLPLMLSGVMTWGMVAGERYVIRALLGSDSLGVYSVAAKFAQAFEVLMVTIVARVYSPRILDTFRRRGERQADRLNSQATLVYGAVAALAAAVMAAVTILVFPWVVGSEFQAGWVLVPSLVAAKIFIGMRNFVAYYLLFTNSTRRIMIGYGTAIVGIVALDLTLIPLLGLRGAALSNLLASALLLVATYLLKRGRRQLADRAGNPTGEASP